MRIAVKTFIKVVYWNALAAFILVGLGAGTVIRRSHEIDRLIVDVGREHKIDPKLISAVIDVESRFDPYAVSDSGAIGLMQVAWPMAQEWAGQTGFGDLTKARLYEPSANIQAGTWLLRHAMDYWEGKVPDPMAYALAEYNAGRDNAIRWAEGTASAAEFRENITYPVVQRYVRDVMERIQ